MVKRDFVVIDEMGLHARPASLVVGIANKFKSNIDIEFKGRKMTLKSIMLVMSLGIKYNETFTVFAEGEDEEVAVDSIAQLLSEQKVCK